ncbi:MAG: flagellar hook-basal body complex protein FliE [Buchnera aphidicola (Nurudea shiraii)]
MFIETMEDSIKIITALDSLMHTKRSEDDNKKVSKNFTDYVKDAFNLLHLNQKKTENESQDLEKNDNPHSTLNDVLVTLQKNFLSLEALMQIRNKITSGCQEMMNLQI